MKYKSSYFYRRLQFLGYPEFRALELYKQRKKTLNHISRVIAIKTLLGYFHKFRRCFVCLTVPTIIGFWLLNLYKLLNHIF